MVSKPSMRAGRGPRFQARTELVGVTAAGPVLRADRAFWMVPAQSVFATMQELAMRVEDPKAPVCSSLSGRVGGEAAHQALLNLSTTTCMQLLGMSLDDRHEFLRIALNLIRRSDGAPGLEGVLASGINALWPALDLETTASLIAKAKEYFGASAYSKSHSIGVVDPTDRTATLFPPGWLADHGTNDWQSRRSGEGLGGRPSDGSMGWALDQIFGPGGWGPTGGLGEGGDKDVPDWAPGLGGRSASDIGSMFGTGGRRSGQAGGDGLGGLATGGGIGTGLSDFGSGLGGGLFGQGGRWGVGNGGSGPFGRTSKQEATGATWTDGDRSAFRAGVVVAAGGTLASGKVGAVGVAYFGVAVVGVYLGVDAAREIADEGKSTVETGPITVTYENGVTQSTNKDGSIVYTLPEITITVKLDENGKPIPEPEPEPEPEKKDEGQPEKPKAGDSYVDPDGSWGVGDPRRLWTDDAGGGGGPTMLWTDDAGGGGGPTMLPPDEFGGGGGGPTMTPDTLVAPGLIGHGLVSGTMIVGDNTIQF